MQNMKHVTALGSISSYYYYVHDWYTNMTMGL